MELLVLGRRRRLGDFQTLINVAFFSSVLDCSGRWDWHVVDSGDFYICN